MNCVYLSWISISTRFHRFTVALNRFVSVALLHALRMIEKRVRELSALLLPIPNLAHSRTLKCLDVCVWMPLILRLYAYELEHVESTAVCCCCSATLLLWLLRLLMMMMMRIRVKFKVILIKKCSGETDPYTQSIYMCTYEAKPHRREPRAERESEKKIENYIQREEECQNETPINFHYVP